jgi:hypothetical protein
MHSSTLVLSSKNQLKGIVLQLSFFFFAGDETTQVVEFFKGKGYCYGVQYVDWISAIEMTWSTALVNDAQLRK